VRSVTCKSIAALALIALAASAHGLETVQSIQRRFDADVKPLLIRYCGDCHFDGVMKGDLDLGKFSTLASVQNARVTWQKVNDNLLAHVMPPGKKKLQPTDAERRAIVAWAKEAMDFCDPTAPRDPGRVTIRRLNRNEFDNTIRDLLGLVDFHPADASFPADDTGYGFDNIGDVLTMSPLLAEKYLAAAEQALDQAIISDASSVGARTLARVDASKLQGYGDPDSPRVIDSEGEAYASIDFPIKGHYEIRVQAAGDQSGSEPAKMTLKLDGRDVKTFDVDAVRESPQHYSTKLDVPGGKHRVSIAFVNDFFDPKLPANCDRNLVLYDLEIVGPLDGPKPGQLELRRKLLFVEPGENGATERDAAAKVLERFASRAYRRPVAVGEVNKLLALFQSARSRGENYEKSVKLVLSAVLVSPNFLFRIEQERETNPDKPYLIGDHELASRLSYFLWSSMPDETLSSVAASGKLRDPAVLREQVRRMLADPKSSEFVTNFVGQWLVMRNLEHHSVDTEINKRFNEPLRADMLREVETFFANLVREDRSVLDLLDGDYTFVNERLAKLYGIEGVTGNDFRRVSLAGTPRGGVLTMAGVLTVTAMPARTSPVKRGKFVLEQLLASPPPPPPPNVPSLSERRRDMQSASLRTRLEAHRADPTCVACHARMDPIGFALENFDAIGRWRTDDQGFAIDAKGSLPEGETFDGPVALRKLLMQRKDDFVKALVEKMMTYALGRGLENYDRCTVKEIAAVVAKDGYRFSTLVNEIVSSDAFQKRRAKRVGE
jgi:hypothetical protein